MQPPRTFQTLVPGGLRRDHVAFGLWRKAKKLGTWDPDAFDLAPDAADWQRLDDADRDALLHLTAYFAAGEEAVTRDLLPLLHAVAADGFLEDELYLTSFLWEEAKHVDFFHRYLQEVTGGGHDLRAYEGAHYHRLFHEALPAAMQRLHADRSPAAQATAAATYNMVVEGVLAETGYHVWYTVLDARGIMPGTRAAVQLVQRDEARHIRYGVYLLSRLVAAHGEPVWQTIQETMMTLLPDALGVVDEVFERAETRFGRPPFGLDREAFSTFAMNQFQKRIARLERARGQSLDAICYGTSEPAEA